MRKLTLALLLTLPLLAQTTKTKQIVLGCVTRSRLSVAGETLMYKDCDDGKVYVSHNGGSFAEVLQPITGTEGGTVTEVAMTVPGSIFGITGSPINVSGTLALTLNSQTAYRVFAVGASDAAPSFMALTADHIPTLAESKITGLVADLADKVPVSRTITAGTGLDGGGELSTDLTISLGNTAVTPGSYTSADIQVNAQGQITAAANGSGSAAAGVRVTNAGTVSIANNSSTPLTFDTEDRDDAAFHSTVTNTSRLTAPSSAWYTITGSVTFSANASGIRECALMRNGVTIPGGVNDIASPTGAFAVSVACPAVVIYLTSGDYIELVPFQNSGGSLNATTASGFAMVRH